MTYIEQKPDGYHLGCFHGSQHERERIIKLVEPEIARHRELKLDASAEYLEDLLVKIRKERDE